MTKEEDDQEVLEQKVFLDLESTRDFMLSSSRWMTRVRKNVAKGPFAVKRAKFLSLGNELLARAHSFEAKLRVESMELSRSSEEALKESSRLSAQLAYLIKSAGRDYKNAKLEVQKATRVVSRASNREDRLRRAVVRIEEERRKAFATVLQPHWETPHHFHMIALEHFRGNKQPQLFEIGELFPGHLRVAACAHQTALLPQKVFPAYKEQQRARMISMRDLSSRTADASFLVDKIKSYEQLYNQLQREVGIGDTAKRQSSEISPGTRIKQRYFRALKMQPVPLEFEAAEDEEENESFDPIDVQNHVSACIASLKEISRQRSKCKGQLVNLSKTKALLEEQMARIRLLKEPMLVDHQKDSADSLDLSSLSLEPRDPA
jgi:hypothetical protein